jgi:hypothetical protein
MFFIYLHVLVPGRCHRSCLFLADLLSKDRLVVSYDGLEARLVMDVHDEFFTRFSSHRLRPGLKSLLTSKIILHTDAMYPFIISRKVQ